MESYEREGAGWQELPDNLCAGALQSAVRRELESKGIRAPLGKQLPAGKPPRPSQNSDCFGVALGAPQPQLLLDSPDGCGQGVWLPRVFVKCIRLLRRNVRCPGLFRKAGSVTRQRALRVSLESGQDLSSPNVHAQASLESGQDLSSPNVHDVASILKQYLRELPSPLLPPSLSPTLEEAWSCEEGRERVKVVMCALLQLPPPHMQVLKELCCLLHAVAVAERQSLMDSHSLAVVITPTIMPTHQSDPILLEAALKTNTGIVQLMIDYSHLIGLAPPHLINLAHQLAEEGVANEELMSGSNDSLEGRLNEIKSEGKREKQKRGSVTDRVLGWGTKLMSTIGSVSRDVGGGSRDQDHAHSPGCRQGDGLQFGDTEVTEKRLFDPSLPPHPHTPKTARNHKRRRSFLGKRRHTDCRHANRHRSLFPNPFRGVSRGGFSRLGAGRWSERRFPWLQGHTPSTPGPDVQLVGFDFSISPPTGERGMMNNEAPHDRDCPLPSNCHVLSDQSALTPVLGNSVLLASVSEESLGALPMVGEGEGGGREGEGGEGGTASEVRVPKTYAVARKHSGKRLRCEVEGGGEGEDERAVKRRHTLYSRSHENHTHLGGIRTSKSATTLHTNSDLHNPGTVQGFSFSRPVPPHNPPSTPESVPTATDAEIGGVTMVTDPQVTVSRHPFTFSNPRQYPSRKQVVANSNKDGVTIKQIIRGAASDAGDVCEGRGGGSVCGASPIPHLPELRRPSLAVRRSSSLCIPSSPAPCGPLPSQLNEGFLLTPFPPSPPPSSPNLLEKISSELVERHRYCLATPLTTPTLLPTKEAGHALNDSYRQAVRARAAKLENPDPLALTKPVALEFNASIEPDDETLEGSKVIQEVSFSFELNSATNRHSNPNNPPGNAHAPRPTPGRTPLSPVHPSLTHRTPHTSTLHPKVPLQRKFALIPLLPQGPRFTDLSSPFITTGRAGKTPKINKRAQMYIIPSSPSGSHGDKENMCEGVHVREWIV